MSVSLRKEARQGQASRARQFRVFRFRRRRRRTRPSPAPRASTASRILYLAKCRGTRSHSENRACWTLEPVISRRNRWQAAQTVLCGFWLPSERQSNQGRPFAGFVFLGRVFTAQGARTWPSFGGGPRAFLALARRLEGRGLTDNDIRHPLSNERCRYQCNTPFPPSWRQSLAGQCERDVLYPQASKASFSAAARHLAAWHPSRNLRSRSGNPGRPLGAHSSWASHPIPSPIPLEARAAPSLAPTQASLAKSSPPLEHHCNNNNIRPWNTRRIQSVIHSSSALPAKPTTNSGSRITLLHQRHKCCFRPLSARFLARPWTWTRFRAGSDLPTYILTTLRLDTQPIGIRTDNDRLRGKMHLPTILAALLLPLAAVAEELSTSTSTSTVTLTKTLTLQRAAVTQASNSTVIFTTPTPTTSKSLSSSTASSAAAASTSADKNAGSALIAAHAAAVAIAGVVAAALL